MTDSVNIDDLSEDIKANAFSIAAILISGNSAEIKLNKDGVLILEVSKKVVR